MANTKITTDALADGAITSAKLGSGAVNTQVASYLSSNSFVDTTALNSAVSTAVSNLVGSAPSTLDTLEELATSIGNSATLSSTLTSSIATKLPLAGGTLTGDLILGDSIKLELGAGTGGDLQLYHDGSHSYVTNTYASGALKLVSDDFRIENASNRNQLKTGVSGAVQLFFDDGSATGLRLGTTAAGVDVTGNIVVSGTVDGVDIAARDAVLTSTTTTAGAALPLAGGTLTGLVQLNADIAVGEDYKIRSQASSGGSHLMLRSDNLGVTSNSTSLIGLNDIIIGAKSNNSGTGNIYFGVGSENKTSGWTDTLTILESGNVGIGTTTPSSLLSVGEVPIHTPGSVFTSSPSSFFSTATLGGTTGNDQKIAIFGGGDASNVSGLALYRYRRATGTNWTTDGFSLRQEVDGTANIYDYMNFAGGNVGIGTTTPGQKLVVEGGNNVFDLARFGSSASDNSEVTIGYFDANANNGIPALITASDFGGLIQGGEHGHLVLGIRDNDATDALDIVSGGGNFMTDTTYDTLVATFKANGNVGIGTSTPDYLLDVSKSTVGGVTDMRVFNEDTTDAASGARGIITVANASVGDPRLVLGITGIKEYSLGIDNSDGDKFKINNGSDPSAGTNYLTIDSGNVGIGTTVPKANLHVEVPGNADGFAVGGKNISLNTSYQTGAQLEVTLGDHQGCYVKVFITGDWSGHSAMAFLGEYFIQNGADAYAEPGMIIREVENTNGIDSISSRIYDGGAYDSFQIQFKLNVPSGGATSAAGNLTYQIMGQFDAVS